MTTVQRSGSPRVSVVVPTRNEARNLEVVLPAIAAVRPPVYEIVVVDGHSVDGTVETARRVLPCATVITQTRRGKGNAMACGFAAATGDVIVMFDADGSADPGEIPAFVSALVAGADFAKGSRFAAGGGSDDITLLRRTGNAGLNGVANALFGTSYTDLCYGYNAFWADLLPVLDLPDPAVAGAEDGMLWGDGFEIETVLNCRVAAAGLKITEVPSVERQRIFGRTNLRTFADGTRVLRTLAAERRRAVHRRLREAGRLVLAQPVAAVEFAGFGPSPYDARAYGSDSYGHVVLPEPFDGGRFDDERFEAQTFAAQTSAGQTFDGQTFDAVPFIAGPREPAALDPAGRAPADDTPTPASGVAVTPREPLDAAPDVGAARSPRAGGRPSGRTGPGAAGPANRDRVGVRYALEEEPS